MTDEKFNMYLAHLSVPDEAVEEGFTQETYVQFLLNLHNSIIKNVVHIIEKNGDQEDVLSCIGFMMMDDGIHDKLKEITLAGLSGDMTPFHEIDGESQDAFNNDNVVDLFPGNSDPDTVH